MNKALNDAKVDKNLFKKWQIEITQDFIEKNFMSLPENQLKEDIRVDARNMISYMRRIEGNTSTMYAELVKAKILFHDVKTKLTIVENQLGENKDQLIELTVSVNRLTSIVEDLYEKLSGSTKRTKLNQNLEKVSKDSEVEIENIENVSTINDWSHVMTILENCGLEKFLYEYLEQELENVYTLSVNKIPIRMKKAKMTRIYTTLKMCKPSDIDMVSETKPKDSDLLLQWKLDCMVLSKQCYENAKLIFEATKCSGNFTRTSLYTKKHIEIMEAYVNDSKEYNEETIVNI